MAAIGIATMRTRGRLAPALALGLALWSGLTARGVEPRDDSSAGNDDPRAVAERLLVALDDDRAHAREAAFAELARLAEEPAVGATVRTAIHEALATADASFEARRSLQRLTEKYPAPGPAAVPAPTDAEIDEWIGQATSDDYGLRLAADAKIRALFSRPDVLGRLLAAVKRRLAEPTVGSSVRNELVGLWKRARAEWMFTDPAGWNLPPVGDEQIDAWLDALETTSEPTTPWKSIVARDHAERELTDLLLRDEYAPKVTAKLQERLEGRNLPAEAVTRLEQLREWCRPALVAEIWELASLDGEPTFSRGSSFPPLDPANSKRQQTTMQFLHVGVPWKNPGDPTERSSHFDFCDDERVHCVDGYTLAPGDYPVGVAFPHPLNPEKFFFHVRNLSTPRRRMLFERELETGYDGEADQARRLKDISRRTCDGFLNGKRELTRELVTMLATLEPGIVSRFAADYLAKRPAPEDTTVQRDIDARMCQLLGSFGTPEVLPTLVSAIDSGRLRAASDEQPFHRGWLAALAIAQRHEWPAKDEWLASLMERTDRLLSDQTPDVGATAAAMLVSRHEADPVEFKLTVPSLDGLQLTELHNISSKLKCWALPGQDERRAVIGWWEGRKHALEAKRRRETGDAVR